MFPIGGDDHAARAARALGTRAAQPQGLAWLTDVRPLGLVVLSLVYLALRLPALLALPLFNDEAIYLVRAQRFPAMLFASGFAGSTIFDGKLIQELLLAALARLPADQLASGRLLSLLCGLGTVLVLAQAGRAVGRPGAGLLAGALYALAPLAAIHDLLAVPDSMLTLVSALVLLASVRFATREQVGGREVLALVTLLVLAMLVKLPGALLGATPALALLTFRLERGERLRRLRLLAVIGAGALIWLVGLRIAGYGLAENQKLVDGQIDRIGIVGRNLALASDWATRYLSGPLLLPPLALLGAAGAARARRTGRAPAPSNAGAPGAARLTLFLLAAGALPPAVITAVGLTVYSRYFLPGWPALLLGAAVATCELWRADSGWRGLAAASLALAVGWGLLFSALLAVAPLRAPLAAGDRFQYLEGWPAGQNSAELGAFIQAEARASGKLTVVSGAELRLGNLMSHIYLRDQPGVRLERLDLSLADAPATLSRLGARRDLLVLVDEATDTAYQLGGRFPGLVLERRFMHAGDTMGFVVYRLRTPPGP